MKKIILVYGGKSAEHNISILSAFSMLEHLVKQFEQVQLVMIAKDGTWVRGPIITTSLAHKEELDLSYLGNENDHGLEGEVIEPGMIYEQDAVVFPILHGPNGEDGTVQGLFEVLNMPYVGAGILTSSCAMDKWMTKLILSSVGIPQVPYVGVVKSEWQQAKEEVLAKCLAKLQYPMYIKPANMGSSVGISKVTDEESFMSGMNEAFKYDRRVVVEQGIKAREIEVAVLGNDDIHTTLAGEVVKNVDFYDFDAKYVNNDVTLQIPAAISAKQQEEVRDYAKRAYEALDGSGLTRCDFFLAEDGNLYLNELNTMPGFTPYSLYPLLWEEMGVSYEDLLVTLIELAWKRHQEKNSYK